MKNREKNNKLGCQKGFVRFKDMKRSFIFTIFFVWFTRKTYNNNGGKKLKQDSFSSYCVRAIQIAKAKKGFKTVVGKQKRANFLTVVV